MDSSLPALAAVLDWPRAELMLLACALSLVGLFVLALLSHIGRGHPRWRDSAGNRRDDIPDHPHLLRCETQDAERTVERASDPLGDILAFPPDEPEQAPESDDEERGWDTPAGVDAPGSDPLLDEQPAPASAPVAADFEDEDAPTRAYRVIDDATSATSIPADEMPVTRKIDISKFTEWLAQEEGRRVQRG